MGDQEHNKPVKEIILSPSEIAEMKDAATTVKGDREMTIQDIENVRSGQLSPSHTPGHAKRRR
jgi:hypothetical protein